MPTIFLIFTQLITFNKKTKAKLNVDIGGYK